MRTRLGPYASETALLYHLRAARGKVFWAGMLAEWSTNALQCAQTQRMMHV